MSRMSISQSAMMADAVHAVHRFPMSSQFSSSRCASEPMDSKRAMCTMHMADKAMYAAMAMSMAAMSAAGIKMIEVGVSTSVSLFVADSLSVALTASIVLLVVSLLLVVLISLTLLLTCLTGQTMLESPVGQIKSITRLASIITHSMQGD